MTNPHEISEYPDRPRSFEIVSKHGRVVRTPDRPGAYVTVECGFVATRDAAGNVQEGYQMQPGEGLRLKK